MLQIIETLAVVILLSIVLATDASADNFLEVLFDKHEASGSIFLYDIFALAANKDGATTCELVTPTGTYSCINVGGEFLAEQSFRDDHMDMSFAGLTAAISGNWTLTWDEGLPTQTVATISFGTVLESDFKLVPTLTAPVDGVPIEIPGDPNPPTIEWNYGTTLPCDAQLDAVEVALIEQAGTEISSGELPCDSLSWTPPSPLTEGTWFSRVANIITDYRLVPDGIDIVEGTWPIENSDWLSLRSIDLSQNEVVPTESSSWGAIKALYRK